jgi:hypothetical protein
MARSRFDQRDKRRFMEAAAMAILHADATRGGNRSAREVINKVGEVWDELEAQCPVTEDD